jgi:hypothetical protein
MRSLPPLKRRGTLADPQMYAVYRWEGYWYDWNNHTTTLDMCRKLIRQACRLYGVPPPRVTWGPNREPYKPRSRPCTYFDPDPNTILLRKRHWNMAVPLHEAAHAIVWHRFGHKRIDHGPTWLGIYLWLLVNNETAPRIALEASALADKLEFTPIDESSPKVIRKQRVDA